MKKINLLILVCSFVSTVFVQGQTASHVSVQYEISFGVGDLGDYISKTSFRGISFQYRYEATEYLLIGGDAGWNVFYEKKEYDSYTDGTATLSGVQWRTQNQVPLLVSADYLIIPENNIRPYIGLGIGTMYTERSTDMGTWRLKQNPWHFAMKPEAGVLVEMSPGTSFKLSVKYMTGFKSGDLNTQGYFTLGIGLSF